MEQNLSVLTSEFVFALREARQPTMLPFGDRGWEAALIGQCRFASGTTRALGTMIAERIVDRGTYYSKEYAQHMRRLLTIGLAPLYRRGDAFPLLTSDDIDVTEAAYPSNDAAARNRLFMDLQLQMLVANNSWGVLFQRELEKFPLMASDRLFVLQVVMAAVSSEELYRINQFRQEEMLNRNQQIAEKAKEALMEKYKSKLGGPDNEEGSIEPIQPQWELGDIGGCLEAKSRIADLAWLLVRPDAATMWGRTPPIGALLSGPPGTGKTMLVHALAFHSGRPLYSATMSDIFTMWYGQSSQKLRGMFDAAKKGGGILFLDEADGIVSGRGGLTTHEESIRVVNEFCKQMELLKPEDKVVVVLATNFQGNLDEAAIRSKRIDVIIKVAEPTEVERLEIFDVHRVAAERKASRILFEKGIDWGSFATATTGFSGADLSAVIDRVLWDKAIFQARSDATPPIVTTEELAIAINQQRAERIKDKHVVGFSKQQ